MTVRLISCTEREAWRAALPDDADVYLDPGYVATAALGDPACLAVVEAGAGRLAIPFVERALPAWLDAAEWRDAESPYGYAGVLAFGDAGAWPACWGELTEALVSRSILNVFIRLNPLATFEAVLPYLLPWHQPTAWIPLVDGVADAFTGRTGRTHRSQVSRARALGFAAEIVVDPAPKEMEDFRMMYNETMERIGAAAWYQFPSSYYEGLRVALGPRLVVVRVRDQRAHTHCQALFMRGPRWAHYHLSARGPDAHNASGHLLFQTAAEWGSSQGLKGIHLGGGATPKSDDSLLLYKCRIGRSRATFRCAGIVTMAERHAALVARWHRVTGREPRRFQAYREAPANVASAP